MRTAHAMVQKAQNKLYYAIDILSLVAVRRSYILD